MVTKRFVIIFSLLFLLYNASSQDAFAQKTITGKVSGEDGLGMKGVSIVVKGTTTGGTTDINGNFTLNVPNDAIIVISFMGYKLVEMLVENQTMFDITLRPDTVALSDAVVSVSRVIPPKKVTTALGIERDKKTLTTSIQTISGDEVNKSGEIDPLTAIKGKVAGLNSGTIAQDPQGQDPGAQVVALIRGRTSWNHSSAPLLVMKDESTTNRLSSINPNDIKSVTVLKSANAAILYGSEGANGVIVITLKK